MSFRRNMNMQKAELVTVASKLVPQSRTGPEPMSIFKVILRLRNNG